VVQLLIKRHANVKATDRHEKTALDLAKDDAIREALQKELQEQDKRQQAEMQAKQVSARQLFQSTDSGTGSFMLVYIDIVVALDCERTVATCDLFVQDLPCMMLDISQTMPPNVPEQQKLPGRLLKTECCAGPNCRNRFSRWSKGNRQSRGSTGRHISNRSTR